jgi:hypothetical protein
MSTVAEGLRAEADRIIEALAAHRVQARLTGGLAIARRCPSALRPPLAREYEDVDLACAPGETRGLSVALTDAGYMADEQFNALHGAQRLYFNAPGGAHHIDVFVGALRMCHTLDLRPRLGLVPDTLTPSDLLLSKLQVVELNAKDALDLLALLLDQPLVADSADALDPVYLADLWGRDWPWWRTSRMTLDKVAEAAPTILPAEEATQAADAIAALRDVLEQCPKSRRWRMRARVGERVRWYELPEEIEQ